MARAVRELGAVDPATRHAFDVHFAAPLERALEEARGDCSRVQTLRAWRDALPYLRLLVQGSEADLARGWPTAARAAPGTALLRRAQAALLQPRDARLQRYTAQMASCFCEVPPALPADGWHELPIGDSGGALRLHPDEQWALHLEADADAWHARAGAYALLALEDLCYFVVDGRLPYATLLRVDCAAAKPVPVREAHGLLVTLRRAERALGRRLRLAALGRAACALRPLVPLGLRAEPLAPATGFPAGLCADMAAHLHEGDEGLLARWLLPARASAESRCVACLREGTAKKARCPWCCAFGPCEECLQARRAAQLPPLARCHACRRRLPRRLYARRGIPRASPTLFLSRAVGKKKRPRQ